MICSERIRQEREKRHMSQEDLAERLEVSRQAVSKWESGASRPTKEKRERLSEIFELPMETWDDPPAEEQTAFRRWRLAAAVLTVALCLSLAGNLALFRAAPRSANAVPSENTDEAKGTEGAESAGIVDLSAVFPEILELKQRQDYDFGNYPTGDYDPALVPFLTDDWERQEQELWGGYFPREDDSAAAFLSVVKTNPRQENGTVFYDVYVLYAVPDQGDLDWKILYRLAEENHYVGSDGGLTVERFSGVLGHEGFRIDYTVGAAACLSDYIILGDDDVPRLMAIAGGRQSPVEFDVDEDGEKEIVSFSGSPVWYDIIDKGSGDWATVYTLSVQDCGVSNLRFAPEMGGFVVADSQDAVLVRYALRDGALIRIPMTNFSALDYPDVVGTEIQFITDFPVLSDGKEPDDVLYSPGGVRITHRQRAYLALQELYGLTGLTVDRCYCAANEFGVVFSLMPDGFNQRCFFSMDFREEYGGSGIPSLYIFWQELGNDWSPLSFAEAEMPESWVPENEVLRWYYDRLNIFATGEAAYANFDELYLTNGDLYIGNLRNTEWGPALFSITGPYPGGEVHH